MRIERVAVRGFANTYIVEELGKAVLIDTGLPGGETDIISKCQEMEIMPNLIIITHGHFDHMGSASSLKSSTSAEIAIHSEDADCTRTGISRMDKPVGIIARLMPLFMRSTKTAPVEPDLVIENEMSLGEYGISGGILLTPGHTRGSVSVILDTGEAFVGDLIMGGFFGKIRPHHPNLPPFEVDRSLLKESVKHLLDHNPNVIYPGHGGPFTPDDVARWYERI
ncbi:MAG: MBL fold metallo-hydrolase [Dehalococcoidia bacterium]